VDLRPNEEQQQLRDAMRRLFDRRMTELVEALPQPPQHDPTRDLADGLALGVLGLGLPDDCGGAGTFADLVVAHEELGRGLAGPLLPVLAAAGRLLVHADGDCREPLLTGLIEGNRTATVAIDERADGYPRVLGGPDVTHVLVLGDGSTVRLFATGATGMQWVEEQSGCDLASWTLHIGDAAPTAAQLEISPDSLAAFRSEVAVLAAARQLGGARAVLDRTIAHVKTREQFDRPIGTFQAVQHQLADVATDCDATELAVAQAAWAVDAGGSATEVRRLADIAALTAATTFRAATLVAHQLHGGMGFVLDSPLHLWSARAISDPAVPRTRRQLLDDLADASGITADGITTRPDHRVSP
jgi:alkylation response protein AidB-like acyl-CoA dehydrogenase